jgi:CrcB protein
LLLKMGMSGFAAVGVGAALGAWMRWGLGLLLNPLFPTLPFGTLAANLIGGYLIGIAMAMLSHSASLPPEIRLFVVTGFLGGLTTFSTFSAEAVTLISRQQYAWLTAHLSLHLLGSLAMTGLGLWTVHLLRN